jgi:hypothetical protein
MCRRGGRCEDHRRAFGEGCCLKILALDIYFAKQAIVIFFQNTLLSLLHILSSCPKMKTTLMKHILFTSLAALFLTTAVIHAVEVRELRCEYRENPIGIDFEKPSLFWKIASEGRGVRQTAYQVLVASTPELLAADKGDLWDSGKVDSDRSIQVEYAGKPLESRQRCYWKVRVWDEDGKPSEWSKPAIWEMGLLKPDDWSANWVGLDGNEPDPKNPVPVVAQAPEELKILKATYSARDGSGTTDVTAKVSSLVKDGVLDFRVAPGLWEEIRHRVL